MKVKVIVEKDISIIKDIEINNPIKLTKDFDRKQTIGSATVTKENNQLIAEFEINEMDLDLYPAIGFQYKSTEENKYNDVKLYEVSICTQRNQDKTIKPIRSQIKQSKTL